MVDRHHVISWHGHLPAGYCSPMYVFRTQITVQRVCHPGPGGLAAGQLSACAAPLDRYSLLVLASLLLNVGANGDSAGPDGLFGAVWRLCHQLDRLVSRAATPACCCGTKDVAGDACGSIFKVRQCAR